MTSQLNQAATGSGNKTRKLVMQTAIGAAVGGSVTIGLLSLLEKSRMDIDDPSRLAALATGIIFALIGAIVGLGVIAPKQGAHLLNVEDADELREQRRPLWRASVIMILLGAAMLALPLASVDGAFGMISGNVAAIVVAVCIVGIAVFSFASRRDKDELMQAVGTEALAVAMNATVCVVGIWAALSHLGYVAWIDPLGMLSVVLLLELGAIFWVSAKRGLMRPR